MLGFNPVSVYVGLDCQPLLDPPGLPDVSVNRYSTPEASLPVVAVMLIELVPPAAGADAKDAGFGTGGVVSAGGVPPVVADAATETAVAFWLELLSRAITV